MNHIQNVSTCYNLIDQDLINLVLKDEIEDIPVPGYNCQPMMLMYDYEGCRKVYGLEKSSWLSKEEYNMTAGNPKIIHFCGNMFTRPWFSNSRHPYRNHWRKYHETSQWKDSQPEYRKASFQYAFQMFARKHLPKKMFVILSAAMQRCFIFLTYRI